MRRPAALPSARVVMCAGLLACAGAPAYAADRATLLADPPDRLAGANASHQTGSWVLGLTPGRRGEQAARAHGLDPVDPATGLWTAGRGAHAIAQDLRRSGLLRFSEPDVRPAFAASAVTPARGWLARVTAGLTAPPRPAGPQVAVVDSGVEAAHPGLAGLVEVRGGGPFSDHGTAVASVITSTADPGTGLWPGLRVVSYGVNRCSGATRAVIDASRRGVPVINMSYGFRAGECLSHSIATQRAVAAGSVLVAAAGNEFQSGNPRLYPAYDPHVLTVVALDARGGAAPFSEANARVDLGALGVDVPVARRGGQTGAGTGTSFAAPAVAAATAWVRVARPDLSRSQVFDVMRRSARDLGTPGWDRRFGFGELDLARALETPAPRRDPREPNDDIRWVDGTWLPAARPLLRGAPRAEFLARLDREEDPVDVMPVWMPPRSAVRIVARSLVGTVRLRVYPAATRTVRGPTAPRAAVAATARRGGGAAASLINPTDRARKAYLTVGMPGGGAPRLDALYRLSLRRIATTARGGGGIVQGPAAGLRALRARRAAGKVSCHARTRISGRYVLAIRGPAGGLRRRASGRITPRVTRRLSTRAPAGSTCRITVIRGQRVRAWTVSA